MGSTGEQYDSEPSEDGRKRRLSGVDSNFVGDDKSVYAEAGGSSILMGYVSWYSMSSEVLVGEGSAGDSSSTGVEDASIVCYMRVSAVKM